MPPFQWITNCYTPRALPCARGQPEVEGNIFHSLESKRYMTVKVLRISALFVLTTIVLCGLPIVPVLEAPVVPPELLTYRWTFISLFKLYRIMTGNWVGMTYRLGWQSLLVIGAMCGVSALVAICLSGRRHYCKSMPENPTKTPLD